ERAELRDLRQDIVGEEAALDRAPAGIFDFFGQRRHRLRAELAGLGLQRMGRQDQAGGVLAVHRVLDPAERLFAILTKIAEDAHEARPQLRAHACKCAPVDEFVHRLFPLAFQSSRFYARSVNRMLTLPAPKPSGATAEPVRKAPSRYPWRRTDC